MSARILHKVVDATKRLFRFVDFFEELLYLFSKLQDALEFGI